MFKRFQTKVTIAILLGMVFILLLSHVLIYKFSFDQHFSALKNRLKTIAQTAALSIDPQQLVSIPLNRTGIQSPSYHLIQEKLQSIQEVNPGITSIYTLTKTKKPGIWQFIVDDQPFIDEENEEEDTAYPGDKYDASRFPAMLKGYEQPSVDQKIEVDEWGASLSGYAPIRNALGESVAILGVDMNAAEIYVVQKEFRQRMLILLAISLIMALILGLMISKKITRPVDELLKATKELSSGNLEYQIQMSGQDELYQLAESFDSMAKKLNLSKQKLLTYFYDAVDSLLCILEARDEYTKDHSHGVAENAAKVAERMGYNKDTIELFKTVTILHDIGKIGIPDEILKKPAKLTDEEWVIMKSHTIIGERILKPLIHDNEVMLGVVRHHHERYDGKGYPDQLAKEDMNIFAAIVSVVDSYDAMTTDRVYRKSLGKEKAIQELKDHRGTQFHPKVVDVFLQILEEEEST